jgi:hypothetical protein
MPAAYALGSALVAGAVGAAYWKRNDIADAYGWVDGHLRYVSHLWDQDEMKGRVQRIRSVSKELGIPFRAYYTLLPPRPPAFAHARTFCILPKDDGAGLGCFVAATNGVAGNEIDAHTGMFEGRTNDGYYQLGLDAAALVCGAHLSKKHNLTNVTLDS